MMSTSLSSSVFTSYLTRQDENSSVYEIGNDSCPLDEDTRLTVSGSMSCNLSE